MQSESRNENKDHDFDVIIVGGGMVGATLALALAPLNLSIAIVEAFPQGASQPSFDDRSIALSLGSKQLLEQFGVWRSMASSVAPIEHIHVSDRGHLGLCRMHAEDVGESALGFVVENRVMGQQLHEQLKQYETITQFVPAEITDYQCRSQAAQLTIHHLDQSKTLRSKLIVAADGTHSPMAQRSHIGFQSFEYGQYAAIANIATDKPPNGWAYERFTEHGPIALLPLVRDRYSVVWTVAPEQVSELRDSDDSEFLKRLQQAFGYRVGRMMKVGQRQFYPLTQRRLLRGFDQRLVFVGNALHTGHPVAGQGFNLGIRDVAALVEMIAMTRYLNEDYGSQTCLEFYWESRQTDIDETLAMTETLVRSFSNTNPALALGRNLALLALDKCSILRNGLAEVAMGKRHDLSGLARGIPLSELHRQPKRDGLAARLLKQCED